MFIIKSKIKLIIILGIIMVINFLPLASAFAQVVTMTLMVEEEVPIQPEPPPTQPPSQGNNNPPTQPPPRVQELPTWIKVEQINNYYLDGLIAPYQFTDRLLTFEGKTNVNDAVIFIKLSDNPNVIYTTNVINIDGYWQWITPYLLSPGSYNLDILAINPSDPTITATANLLFDIIEQIIPGPVIPMPQPQPVPLPGPEPLPQPPIGPEIKPGILPKPGVTQPGVIIPPEGLFPGIIVSGPLGKYDFYSLNVRVLNKNQSIYPKEKLKIEVDLRYFGEKVSRPINIKYLILDEKQNIILTDEQLVAINKHLIFEKNYITSFTIDPGRYTIIAEIKSDKNIIQSSDSFWVRGLPLSKPLYQIASAVDLDDYISLIIILSCLFIFFFIVLYKQTKAAEKISKKITIDDLISQHYFDLE